MIGTIVSIICQSFQMALSLINSLGSHDNLVKHMSQASLVPMRQSGLRRRTLQGNTLSTWRSQNQRQITFPQFHCPFFSPRTGPGKYGRSGITARDICFFHFLNVVEKLISFTRENAFHYEIIKPALLFQGRKESSNLAAQRKQMKCRGKWKPRSWLGKPYRVTQVSKYRRRRGKEVQTPARLCLS